MLPPFDRAFEVWLADGVVVDEDRGAGAVLLRQRAGRHLETSGIHTVDKLKPPAGRRTHCSSNNRFKRTDRDTYVADVIHVVASPLVADCKKKRNGQRGRALKRRSDSASL